MDALRLLEPRAERLAFLQDPDQRPRVVLLLQDSPTRVPLGSRGEGLRRLLTLALTLGASTDGCLLVDEVDTGLHYTALERTWKLLIEGAERANAQVFATTHSLDCIRSLASYLAAEPGRHPDVHLHRIEPVSTSAITFTADEVCSAIEHESELRGWVA